MRPVKTRTNTAQACEPARLASHVLALSLRTVAEDWEQHYGLRPWLAETLVDSSRFTGQCYRAANWIDVGQTTGRGRMDHTHQRHGSAPKRIFLYPLVHDARSRLVNAEGKKHLQING